MNELYRAPGAAVGLREAAYDNAPPPPQVRRAVRILWAALAVSLVTLHPAIRGEWWLGETGPEYSGVALTIGLLLAGIFLAIYAALTVCIRRRRNWARWTMLAFLVLGWAMGAVELAESFAKTPIAAVADLVVTAAELWACFLIFRGPGAAWFRRQAA